MTSKTICELSANHSFCINEALQGDSGGLNGVYMRTCLQEAADWETSLYPLIAAGQYKAVSAMYGMFELCYLGREEEF